MLAGTDNHRLEGTAGQHPRAKSGRQAPDLLASSPPGVDLSQAVLVALASQNWYILQFGPWQQAGKDR